MAIGPILSGVGSLIGGLGGIAGSFFGGKKDNYHPEVWRNDALKNYMQQIRGVKEAAKAYGIHPLALLGSNVGAGGFAQPVGGSGGSFAGDRLSGVSAALGDMFSTAGALYESDQDRQERERDRLDRLDQVARDRMERRIERATEERFRSQQRTVQDAEIRRLDSETMLNAARTRTELQQLDAMRRGGMSSGATTQPGEVVLPYTGIWRLKPGTSSAGDVQNTMGEPFEWLAAGENAIWNYLNPDPREEVMVPVSPTGAGMRFGRWIRDQFR